MKTEKIMQEIMKALELSKNATNTIEMMKTAPKVFECKTILNTTENLLAKLYLELKEDLRKELNKKTAPKQSKMIDDMVKSALRQEYHNINGYSPYKDKFAFLDGYHILIADQNFGYKKVEKPLNVEPYLIEGGEPIIIDIKALRLLIAENGITKTKNPKKVTYKINEEVSLNPIYLLNLLEFAGTDTIYYHNEKFLVTVKDSAGVIRGMVMVVRNYK